MSKRKPSPGVCGRCGRARVQPTPNQRADAKAYAERMGYGEFTTSGHTYNVDTGKLVKVQCIDHEPRRNGTSMPVDDRYEFTVRLYPREIVYWDDPHHPRFTDPNWSKKMGHDVLGELSKCASCDRPLLVSNLSMADGCPCNSPRGVNHGRVPVAACTCVTCDPAQTGGSRFTFSASGILQDAAARIGEIAATHPAWDGKPMPLEGVKQPGLDPTTDAIAAQNAEREQLIAYRDETRKLIANIAKADDRAVAMYYEAHPDARPLVMPEHRATVIPWLLEQLDSVTAEADKLRAAGELFNALKTPAGQSRMQMFDQFKAELEEPLRKEIEQLRQVLIDRANEIESIKVVDHGVMVKLGEQLEQARKYAADAHEQIRKLTSDREIRDAKIDLLSKSATPRDSDRDQIRRLTVERDDLKRANNEFPEELAKLKREIETLEDRRDADTKAIERMAGEAEQNRRQIDALTKQRDHCEGRFNEANHLHGETSAALAAMTIKWLYLENGAKRDVLDLFEKIRKTSEDLKAARAEVDELKQAQANHERHNGDLAAARILIRRAVDALPPRMRESYGNAKLPEAIEALCKLRESANKRLDVVEIECWRSVQMIDPASGLPHFTEQNVDVERAVEVVIVGLLKEVNSLRVEKCSLIEQLGVADADRVPLAQDLEIVRSDLKTAKESIGRMADYIGKAERVSNSWRHAQTFGDDLRMLLGDQVEAADAYETACAQAANEGADPSQEELAF